MIIYWKADAETEDPIIWQPDTFKELAHWKRPDSLEKTLMLGKTEAEEGGCRPWDAKISSAEVGMLRHHHWLHGPEFDLTPGNSEGQWP